MRRVSPEKIARARMMKAAGASRKEIVTTLGVCAKTLQSHGIAWREVSSHPPERVAEIKRLYIDQGLPASTVARMLGLASRHVVIGVGHRHQWKRPAELQTLNLARAKKATKKPDKPKPVVVAAVAVDEPVVAPPVVIIPFATIEPRPFIDRGSGCPWIVSGDGVDAMACCGVVVRGSYCSEHASRAYMEPKTSAKDLVRYLRRHLG